MATGSITSTGLGSGLDIESLVTKLMAVEQQPITALQTKEAKQTAKLSALGQIKSALSNFQTAAAALDTRTEFAAYTATIGDTNVASVKASSAAKTGNYELTVNQLASSQKLVSTSLSSGYTFADGTLQLKIGSATTSISISSAAGNNSLSGVRDAINASDSGVTASLLNDGTGVRLILTSKNTGSENAVTVSGLGLDYDPTQTLANGSLVDSSKTISAANAKFSLDGIAIERASNVVTDAIDGVTLALTKPNIGSTTNIAVNSDTTSIQTKVASFVTAYNTLATLMKSQTSYNADSKVAGTLNGDSTVRNIQSQLRGVITSTVGNGSIQRLNNIGIQFKADGTLSFDTTKFQKALSDPTNDVAKLFVKDGTSVGIASQLDTSISKILGTGGALTARTDGINATIKSMDKQIASLEDRLTSVETRYRAQFSKLDTTVASLNSTSTYLTQQLTALNKLAGISS